MKVLQKSTIQRIKIPESNSRLTNNLRYFPCQIKIIGDITKPYYLDIYFKSRFKGTSDKFNNEPYEINAQNIVIGDINTYIFNAQSSQNVNIPLKISSLTGNLNDYYFGFFVQNKIRKMKCIETSLDTSCSIPKFDSLFSQWNDFKHYSIGLYFNESLARSLTPGIHFYGKFFSSYPEYLVMPDKIEIFPSTHILDKNPPNHIILKSNETWVDFPYNENHTYSIYYSYSSQVDIQRSCEYMDERHLNCSFIPIIGGYTGELKSKLSFEPNYFHPLPSIYIFSNDVQINSFSPQTVNITHPSRIYISGTSIVDGRITIRFDDFDVIEQAIYHNLTSIAVDFHPKMFNPKQLPAKTNLSISFDNGNNYQTVLGNLLIDSICNIFNFI